VPVEGTAASNAAATAKPVMVGGKYNATTQTFDDGDIANLQVDANGRLIVTNGTLQAGEDLANNTQAITAKPVAAAQYSPGFVQNAGSATAGNAKVAAGAVVKARATNANAAVRYLQVHNTTSARRPVQHRSSTGRYRPAQLPYRRFSLLATSTCTARPVSRGRFQLPRRRTPQLQSPIIL
jgi:hypothetical protein